MGQPRIVQPSPRGNVPEGEPDFSLMLGGPLYRLYLRAGLARPPLKFGGRRILILTLICWFPLLLLSVAAGYLTQGVAVPFLRDPEVHARLLIALPLLILAEVYVQERIQPMVPQFVYRGLIAAQDQERFAKIVDSAMRLRNSVIAELVLLVVALTFGYWFWRSNVTLTVSSWYAVRQGTALRLTAAGWWYAFVSLFIFRFILLRWYFRLFVWYRFLWQVKSLPLHLNLYHPDRAGGLGFLSMSPLAFAPVAVAHTILLAGVIYAHILYQGARLPSYKMQVVGILIFFMLALMLPLGFFAAKLDRAAHTAKREFGALASHYVDDFHRKWIEGGPRAAEPLLGTPDIQSLADLGNSFAVASSIRLIPITKEVLIRLAAMIVLPLVPLVLTMFSPDQVLGELFKLVF